MIIQKESNVIVINPIVALIIFIILMFVFRWIVKKNYGWNPESIPIEKNIKEMSIPFQISLSDEIFFGNGKYKACVNRDGSLRIVRSSGFNEWSTPKEKKYIKWDNCCIF